MTVLNAAAPVEVQPGDGGAIRLLTIAGAGFAVLTAMFYVWKLSWTGQSRATAARSSSDATF